MLKFLRQTEGRTNKPIDGRTNGFSQKCGGKIAFWTIVVLIGTFACRARIDWCLTEFIVRYDWSDAFCNSTQFVIYYKLRNYYKLQRNIAVLFRLLFSERTQNQGSQTSTITSTTMPTDGKTLYIQKMKIDGKIGLPSRMHCTENIKDIPRVNRTYKPIKVQKSTS